MIICKLQPQNVFIKYGLGFDAKHLFSVLLTKRNSMFYIKGIDYRGRYCKGIKTYNATEVNLQVTPVLKKQKYFLTLLKG